MKLTDSIKNAETTDWLSKGLSENEISKIKELALISAKIEMKRIEMGMNQKEFAKYMDVSQGMISKWESGAYNFTITTLHDICEKLDLEFEANIKNKEYHMEDSYKLIDISVYSYREATKGLELYETSKKEMEIA